jgi:hypothetical protein
MAELGTSQGSGLFQDWYDRYVKPKKYSLTDLASSPETSLPASPTPIPSAPVAAPVAATPMEVAPPAEATPSLTDRFNSGLSRVGEGLKDPAKMGLLTAGLSMMATPPRQVPYSNAEILGNAGLAGVGMYEKALEAQRRQQVIDQTAEEHKLAREDQSLYRKGMLSDRAERTALEVKKEVSQSKIRTANARYRDAMAGKVEALNSEVDADWAEAMGHPEWIGMTYAETQSQRGPIVQAMKPPPTALVTGDTGTATVIQKTPGAVYPGVGKTKTPPAGVKGGSEKAFQHEWRKAQEALPPGSTNEQIAAKKLEMFPPSAVQAATAKKKRSSLLSGGGPPLPGYILHPEGKTVGGKRVWISPDGKSGVVEK